MDQDPAPSLSQLLLWLCSIPSFTGEEEKLCTAIAERLQSTSVKTHARRHANSLVVQINPGTARPKIILAGHLDVVRTSHDGPPRIEGDRLYGPGASDMKSGLALMIDLVETDVADIAGVDLTLIFYAGEEGPYVSNELGLVLDHEADLLKADLAVCLEPSDNKLSVGACGTLQASVIFRGRTSHSARPWQGDNAIHKAGEFLIELGALPPKEIDLDGFVYRTVTSVTMAQGGRGRNVIPDEFTLNVNHRFAPGVSIQQAQRDLEALVRGRADITWIDLCPSALPHASHPLVDALRHAGVVAVEPKQAWTDVARFAQLGLAAVNFGPGDNAQAHQRNEWTSISKLVQGRSILRRWLRAIGKP